MSHDRAPRNFCIGATGSSHQRCQEELTCTKMHFFGSPSWLKAAWLQQRVSVLSVISPDKRTDPWLLVYSPVPVAFIFLLYLGVVWLGPRLMRNRQPVDLKVVLIVYNFAMVGLSAYMFHEVRESTAPRSFLYPCCYLFDCPVVPGHILALQLQLPLSACGLQRQPSGNEGRPALWCPPTRVFSSVTSDLCCLLTDGPSLLVVLLQQDHRAE